MLKVSGCCCFDLETVGKIIAWLGVVGSVLLIFANVNFGEHDLGKHTKVQAGLLFDDYDFNFNTSWIVLCLIGIVVYALALFGIHKRNHNLLVPAIIINLLGIMIDLIVCALLLIITKIFFGSFDGSEIVTILFIKAAISMYYFFVLYSLYDKFKYEKEPPSYSIA